MLLAGLFIDIEGKQKITIASICDKKETLQNFSSLIVKRYKRSPKIVRCEVTHNSSFSHGANLSVTPRNLGCTRRHLNSRCQGLFPPYPFFEGKALGTKLGEFETVMQTRDEVEGLHNCRDDNASSVYIRLCKQRKKVFYCFYKINFPRKNAKLFVWH